MVEHERKKERVAVVLWTGGKDSALALHRAAEAEYSIRELVTFAPPRARFRAHPLAVMRMQAEVLGIPHRTIEIRRPYRASYERALGRLHRAGIRTLVTGDIDLVAGAPNWIRECARPFGLEVFAPLWRQARTRILNALLRHRFEVTFSCVEGARLAETWLGRTLDRSAVRELARLSQRYGVDPAGEQGEYHTITLDAPMFHKRLAIRAWTPVRYGAWSYMQIDELALLPKAGTRPGPYPRPSQARGAGRSLRPT